MELFVYHAFVLEYGKNGIKLFKSPLTFWTTADCSRFQSHSVGNTDTSTTHGNAVIAMADFYGRAVPIDQQMDQLMQQQINENREKMKSIIRRDDNPDDASLQGIFQALLQFRIDSGDTKLKEHLEKAPRNATYRSVPRRSRC